MSLAHKSETAVKLKILWKNLNGLVVDTFRARVTNRVITWAKKITHINADWMWNSLAYTTRDAAMEASWCGCWDNEST